MTQATIRPRTAFIDHPGNILMNLIVALLAPMFLSVTGGDAEMARAAAMETVNAYRARNHADLIAVAQIVAFGLAALCSLSLSMADDLTVEMILRLHGNANALNRSAEQNRRVLNQPPRDNSAPTSTPNTTAPNNPTPPEIPLELTAEADPDDDDTHPFPNLAAMQQLAEEACRESAATIAEPTPDPPVDCPTLIAAEKRHQAMWAIAMVKESSEISASIPNLPPAQRRAAEIRAGALSRAANELLTGVGSNPPPRAATS